MAGKSPVLTQVRPDGLEDAPQLQIDIDRDKANALGVSFDAINTALSTALGSSYVNDFPNQGRLQRVVVQADAPARMQPEDLLKLNASNSQGQPVPLSAFATTRWVKGAMQTVRYNGYPAMRISGGAAPGYSTGAAMAEMEKLAAQLPQGFGFEWTGQSREEKLAGSQAMILYGFAILAVFLCLAALYESWSIPLAVILVVPLGVLGVLLATLLRGYANDVYFQVGLITIIGLSAKNAILIIEFAKDLQAQGKGVIESALAAAHLRFRPIIMTSLAFMLGVLPLAIATGAGSASQRAIGTGVIGGMITGTALAVFFVPVFFVVVRGFFKGSARQQQIYAEHAKAAGVGGPMKESQHMNKTRLPHCLAVSAAAAAGRLLDDPDLRAPGRARRHRLARAERCGCCRQRLAAASPPPTSTWQDFFTDPRLRQLIDAALAQQPRPARGRAQHRAGPGAVPDSQRADQFPTVGAARDRLAPARRPTAASPASTPPAWP